MARANCPGRLVVAMYDVQNTSKEMYGYSIVNANPGTAVCWSSRAGPAGDKGPHDSDTLSTLPHIRPLLVWVNHVLVCTRPNNAQPFTIVSSPALRSSRDTKEQTVGATPSTPLCCKRQAGEQVGNREGGTATCDNECWIYWLVRLTLSKIKRPLFTRGATPRESNTAAKAATEAALQQAKPLAVDGTSE